TYVADPGGHIVGLRERDRLSTAANDIEAWRRVDLGATFDPGAGPMPTDIQCLGWIALKVRDLDAVAAFYRDVCELNVCNQGDDAVCFDLGDNLVLQVLRNAEAQGTPVSPD